MKIAIKCLILGFVTVALYGVVAADKPAAVTLPPRPAPLTPPAPATPRINGPSVFGVRPGSPFLYSVPATGERPMTFAVEGLPEGLKLDPATGRMTGSLAKAGESTVTLIARNAKGENKKSFRIVVGEQIGLTPPMGWNSWNCWHGDVTQEAVLSAAKSMVAAGLDQHGWTYVNIDDAWQGARGGQFNAIQCNKKFPDMKGLADQIHDMGLKFGIYSGPWTMTYAGYIGSSCDNENGAYDWMVAGNHNENMRYTTNRTSRIMDAVKKPYWRHGKFQFFKQDARQWALWGVDYLKFDWRIDVPIAEAMGKALRESGRDIFYSLSNGAQFTLAADWARVSNCWRTTGDIGDTWESISKIGFNQEKWIPFQGPGHYNDPDMFQIGCNGGGKPKRLTPDEQYTHVSLWCLLSAPLLLGCDLDKLDPFTLGLITNDEVLDLDQDPLCKAASCVATNGDLKIYLKPLADGTRAVGLFNTGTKPIPAELLWKDAGLKGPQRVRDLWRQKDLGTFDGKFPAEIPSHGVVLLKLTSG